MFWIFLGVIFGVYCNLMVLFWMVEENIQTTVMQHRWWALALRISWLCQQAGCWQCCATGGCWQRWARTEIRRLVGLLMAQNQLSAPEKWAFSQDRQTQHAGKLRVRICAFRDKEQPHGRHWPTFTAAEVELTHGELHPPYQHRGSTTQMDWAI